MVKEEIMRKIKTKPKFASGTGKKGVPPLVNIDSTLQANKKLDFVRRLYEPNTPSIPTPPEVEGYVPGQTSTHLLGYDPKSRRVYPRVVNQGGRLNFLQPDPAYDYADSTGEFIEFPTAEQAKFFTQNYKRGKGVLPSYNGGTGKKGVEKDPNIHGPIGFLNSYYNSPEFANRGGINVVANMQAGRYKPIKNAFDFSFANPVEGTIYLSDQQAKSSGMDINNDVLPHEYSHLTRGLSSPDEALKIASLNKRAGKAVPLLKSFIKSNNNYYGDKVTKKLIDLGIDTHTIDPDENYADLNSLRYLMYKQGIYDTRKGPMSMEHLQKAMSDPYIKKQFTFKRMLENFEPQNIVELNNKVAKNKPVTPSFKNGGTVMPTTNKTRKIPTTKEVPTFNKQQYDDMAEWNYYMEPLRNKLRAKNPETFDPFTQSVTQARTGAYGDQGTQFGRYELSQLAGGFKQNPLTEEEIQESLKGVTPYGGQNPYERFNALKNQFFAFDEAGYSKRPQATPGLDYNQVYPLRTSSYGSPEYEYTPQIVNGQLVVNGQPVSPTSPLRPRTDIAGKGEGYAMGSSGVPSRRIKVTDDEFGKTPQGRQGRFRGQGGIDNVDAEVPVGTKIFSNDIKLDGKSMSDRAALRASREARIAKILEKDDQDAIAKNTLKRIKNQNKMQEEQDLQYQEMLAPQDMIGAGDMPQYQTGTSGVPYEYDAIGNRWGQYMPQQYPVNLGPTQGMQGGWYPGKQNTSVPTQSEVSPFNTTGTFNSLFEAKPRGGINASNLYQSPPSTYTGGNAVAGINPVALDKPMAGADIDFSKALQDVPMSDIQNELGGVGAEGGAGKGIMAGNVAGAIGMGINAIGPILSTLANRRATKPNINRWEGYGKDALDTNEAAVDALNFSANENAINNAISRNTANQGIDNSVSSLNVGRAMKAMGNYAADRNANMGNAAFAGQRSDLFNQRSQMLLNRDSAVMGGRTARDEREAQDRDAFYTALNRDIGNVGTSFQEYGRNMNQEQFNQDYLDMLPYTSTYGTGFQRRRGRLVPTTTKTS